MYPGWSQEAIHGHKAMMAAMSARRAALSAAVRYQKRPDRDEAERDRLWEVVYALQRGEKVAKAAFAADHLPPLAGVVFCQR